jgi:hypothetical protein
MQVERAPTGRRRPKKVNQGRGLTRTRARAIEFFGTHHDDGLPALFDHALRPLRAHAPEQLAESRLGLMELPDRLP